MSRLAAIMAAAMALSSSGAEWLICDVSCEASERGVATTDEHHDEEDAPCGPGTPECSCCFNLRLAMPDTHVILPAHAAEPIVWMAPIVEPPEPSPGEILHVPRTA